MPDKAVRQNLKYRLSFYLGGIIFATASYIAGVWAYGAESASWGDVLIYKTLTRNLEYCFRTHIVSLFGWELICVGIAAVVGHRFDREVYYRRKAEQRANVDGVTEIYNHQYFQERLSSEIERASRFEHKLSLVILDLDHFKSFNDAWGHQEGDKVLKWFASVCAGSVRNIDIVARYGGEEFVIILPETGAAEALAVAERIREATEKQSLVAFGKNRGITASAGVASFPDLSRTRHSLILSTDAALYSAKQRGRNRCVVYDDSCNRLCHASSIDIRALIASDDLSAIEALAAVIDARDAHMRGHSQAVMSTSLSLAQRLGMSGEEVDSLRSAALLHDLGTIGTPEEVLGKDAKLDEDERRQIENHVHLGSQILRRIQQMSSILPAVKHHHERFDGKGYPNGLSGKNIPLAARIIAIADAYDAMTSTRSYRSPMSHEEALSEIGRCSGSQFDPELVEAFLDVMQARSDQAA